MSFARSLAAAALSVGLGVALVATEAPFSAAEDATTPVATATATTSPSTDTVAGSTSDSESGPGTTGTVTTTASTSSTTTTPSATTTTTPSATKTTTAKPKKKKLSKRAQRAKKAVKYAKRQIGDMYGWGATGPRRFDCSGLTYASYRAAGKRIPRTSYGQWRGLKRVKIKNLRPGDIVVYYGGSHVGIYVGGGKIVHASRPGRPIKKVKLRSMPIKAAVRP